MVKIVTTIDGNIPSKFAHSFNIMKMTQGFNDAGFDAQLVTISTFKTLINRLKIGNVYEHYGVSKDLNINYVPIYSREGIRKSIGIKGANKKITDRINTLNVDVAFCRSYLTCVECIDRGIPVIIETHTTNYAHPDLIKVFSIAKNDNFLGLVTISPILAEEYIERGVPRHKVLVLDDGVDLSQYDINDDRQEWRHALDLPKDKKILLYAGGLYKEKGIVSILETQKELEKKHGDSIITVFIGGNKEQVCFWKKFSEENDIKGSIFLGFKSNYKLPHYYKAADVLMMPYDTKVNYKVMDINTTSPLKLFEYMASHRPIVSSNIPVVSKIVKHMESAYLAEENNIASQVVMVEAALFNRKQSEVIAENSYIKVSEFEWKKRCEKIIKELVIERKK